MATSGITVVVDLDVGHVVDALTQLADAAQSIADTLIQARDRIDSTRDDI